MITKIDDHQITGSDSLVATIRSYRPGDTVTVTYVRDGDEQTAELALDSDSEASNSEFESQTPTERRRWVSEKGGV